jgi:transcriptional regulator with XRE-family HTH domain
MHTSAVFHIGSVIRAMRKQRGKGLIQLATEIGISPTTLSRIERTGQNFERATLAKIANGLLVSETDIFAAVQHEGGGSGSGIVPVKGLGRKEADGEAGVETDRADVEEEDVQSMPDADQIHAMTTALRLAPPERRDEFIQHCFSYAMTMRQRSRRRATGTDPNG